MSEPVVYSVESLMDTPINQLFSQVRNSKVLAKGVDDPGRVAHLVKGCLM